MIAQRIDLFACDKAASFLQSGFWGSFKARFGWEVYAFEITLEGLEGENVKALLVLRRKLFPGFAIAYIPWGPELPPDLFEQNNVLKDLAETLKNELPKDTAFIRFDPPWFSTNQPNYPQPPFIRSSADIQPPDTVIIDLALSMETLLEQMKPKWRYNAKLALKKGVKIRQGTNTDLDLFYRLLKETAQRDGIAIHSKEYYRLLIENEWYEGLKPDIRIYIAEHDCEELAAAVSLFWGEQAVYLYGASSNQKRNLMATYALQVKIMEDAKNAGCLEYDLFGIPPNEDPDHPMAGLYRFKTGFGGKIIHRPGSWDFPCRPLIYSLFRCVEKMRKQLMTRKKRRLST